jgi:hypothetical protein
MTKQSLGSKLDFRPLGLARLSHGHLRDLDGEIIEIDFYLRLRDIMVRIIIKGGVWKVSRTLLIGRKAYLLHDRTQRMKS